MFSSDEEASSDEDDAMDDEEGANPLKRFATLALQACSSRGECRLCWHRRRPRNMDNFSSVCFVKPVKRR